MVVSLCALHLIGKCKRLDDAKRSAEMVHESPLHELLDTLEGNTEIEIVRAG